MVKVIIAAATTTTAKAATTTTTAAAAATTTTTATTTAATLPCLMPKLKLNRSVQIFLFCFELKTSVELRNDVC